MMEWQIIKRAIFILALLLFSLAGIGQAKESWATDPRTGAKVGWIHEFYSITAANWPGSVVDGKAEGKGLLIFTLTGLDNKQYNGQLEGEMIAGRLHGHIKLKLSDGDTFEGTCVNGIFEGKGVYYFANRNRIYDGEYKNNLPDGYGIYKETNGKIVYEGQWLNGNPVTRPLLQKVLNVPWGASEEETKKIMLMRPKTSLRNTLTVNTAIKEQQYWGPFNDIEQWILFRFFNGKMYLVGIVQQFPEDKLDTMMERYDVARKGLTQRYGNADIEKGKYLDAKLAWMWSGKYALMLSAERLTTTTPPSFILRLLYFEGPTFYKAEETIVSNSNSDF